MLNATTYDSYGHIVSQSNPAMADSLSFTGREFDAETGLYYFRARYYNPDLGRFQSEDPIGLKNLLKRPSQPRNPFGDPAAQSSQNDFTQMQSTAFAAGDFNISRYVDNNPLGLTDPWGLASYHDTPNPNYDSKRSSQEYLLVV